MQLPPTQPHEPEWLQIQSSRRTQTNNFTYGGLMAMGFGAIPYAIAESIASAPHFGRFALGVFLFAATLTVASIACAWRFDKGSFKRYFAGWSVATHGLVALTVLITLLQRQ